jgi:hypothetical protein
MTDTLIIEKISSLPENLKMEALDFIDFLLSKKINTKNNNKKRKFGFAKGDYVMSDDFDEPLECFKEYM